MTNTDSPGNSPLKLAVFDDNRDFRESLVQLFNSYEEILLSGVYKDCSDILEKIGADPPDVILMDIDMPGVDGIMGTAEVKQHFPYIHVVMLTVSESEEKIFQALRNGAIGYLLKKSGPDEIVNAVFSVIKGGSPMTPAIARKVLQYFHTNTDQIATTPVATATAAAEKEDENDFENLSAGLTPREREILEALVDGMSYKMIAAKYFISTDTVKNHIQGIYRKLHVNSKGQAISFALRKGIAGQK